NATQVRAAVGVLTEHHGLHNRRRAREYLEFFGELYGLSRDTRKERAEKMLFDFGLQTAENQRIGEFSKGMRQKLALGRALLHKPRVLLLDEPTSAMDPASARLVRNEISALRSSERSIIICTHNLSEAEELADRIAIIRRGKIIANDSPAALKQEMLGDPVYEVRFSESMNGNTPTLPHGVDIQERGEDWLRFISNTPDVINPMVVKNLVKQGFHVVSIQEISRSLEQVYLQAVSKSSDEEMEDHVR
ncbi:MAG: ABC transporter ATP-binding protein, partial [Chloroflexi bacterium]|nr:ABC transporter ATP-binding protein [Chloroflexota bacterium]